MMDNLQQLDESYISTYKINMIDICKKKLFLKVEGNHLWADFPQLEISLLLFLAMLEQCK